jgi:hypothetical protein
LAQTGAALTLWGAFGAGDEPSRDGRPEEHQLFLRGCSSFNHRANNNRANNRPNPFANPFVNTFVRSMTLGIQQC